MKSTTILITALTAALGFGLTSCGDKKSSAENTGQAPKSEANASEAAKDYPLDVCVVSGEDLGSMGKPHIIDYQGTEVRFCCKDCVADFNKDPEKYLTKLKAGETGAPDADQPAQ